MGISIDKLIHHFNNTISPVKSGSRNMAAAPSGRKFDEVMICSSASQIQEKKISEALEKEVLYSVKMQPSEEKIQSLKRSVETGEYQMNAGDIVSRILLQEGALKDE